jgi:hypothetical protein
MQSLLPKRFAKNEDVLPSIYAARSLENEMRELSIDAYAEVSGGIIGGGSGSPLGPAPLAIDPDGGDGPMISVYTYDDGSSVMYMNDVAIGHQDASGSISMNPNYVDCMAGAANLGAAAAAARRGDLGSAWAALVAAAANAPGCFGLRYVGP